MSRAASEGGVWGELLMELQLMTRERMEAGRDLLNDIIASGELNILDRKVVEGVKQGKIDPAFVQVGCLLIGLLIDLLIPQPPNLCPEMGLIHGELRIQCA